MLKEGNADTNIIDENGNTILTFASQNWQAAVAVKALIKADAQVDVVINDGRTASMLATANAAANWFRTRQPGLNMVVACTMAMDSKLGHPL